MANNLYTTKTAALKATKADVRKANVKSLDAEGIKIKGQDISELWGLNLPEDYKKFVTRCELPEDEYWSLWDDNGNLVYMNFADKLKYSIRKNENQSGFFYNCRFSFFNINLPALIDGTSMFSSCTNLKYYTGLLPSLINGNSMFLGCRNLTSFNSDLPSLTEAWGMFSYCSNLTTFTSDLSSLTDGECMFNDCYKLTTFTSDLSSLTNGYEMFLRCRLSEQSVEKILTTIPSKSYVSGANRLTLGILESSISKFNEITGNTNDIPVIGLGDSGGDCGGDYTTIYKGWEITVYAYSE